MTTAWIEVALVPQSEIAVSPTKGPDIEVGVTTTQVEIQSLPPPQIEVMIGGPSIVTPKISEDPDNRAARGTDGGVFVSDDLTPDPLAYYILARG